jgi:rod shape-determining protein MreD
MRILLTFALGLLFMLLQSSVFPRFLPVNLKPDLLLILVVYLGLCEGYLRGGLVCYLLGCLKDVFAGIYTGLFGFTFLLIFYAVRGVGGRFNSENPFFLLVLTLVGTMLEGVIIIFSIGFFADHAPPLQLIGRQLLPQMLLNLLAAIMLLLLVFPFLRRLAPPRQLRDRHDEPVARYESP